jgi:hypothetical protein
MLSVLSQALLGVGIVLISVLDAPVLASKALVLAGKALFEFIIKKTPAGSLLRYAHIK